MQNPSPPQAATGGDAIHISAENVADHRRRLLVVFLQLCAVMIWGLHLFVRTLPATPTPIPGPESAEAAWWGLWPIRYLPRWIAWLATLALAGTIGWFQRTHAMSLPARPSSPSTDYRLAPRYYLLAGLLLIAFFAFPIVHTRWGDAYMLANGLAWPDPALRLTHSWQAPLDVLLHSRVWLLLGEARGWTNAAPIYHLLSPLAGALYLAAVLALAADARLAPAWVTFGLLTSLGLLQLFFGYVENYSFAAAGILIYLWLGLGVLADMRPLWLAASVLAVTNATHPSTVVLAPSLLVLGWFCWRRAPAAGRGLPILLQVTLPMVIVAGATVALMEAGGHGIGVLFTSDRPGGGDARWFVPLFRTATRWEHYTMFSWLHLRDFLNQQMLVAPIVLPSLVVLGVYAVLRKDRILKIEDWEKRARSGSPIFNFQSASTYFLLAASLTYLLFTWVWNPDYGGQRDWDLFSLAVLPLTLLLIVLLPRALGRGAALVGAVSPLLLVQALHTIAWVYQNTLPWEWP